MRTLVRRINEWDAPTMLKIYAPYVEGSNCTPEISLPSIAEFVQRIDMYTYGRGWIMSEIDGETVGFCLLTENRKDPENFFTGEIQLYVKPGFLRRGVGSSLYSLMLDIMEFGNKKSVIARIPLPNKEVVEFHKAWGFVHIGVEKAAFEKLGKYHDVAIMEKTLCPKDPLAVKATKPYLIESADYEESRIKAGKCIKERTK